ncbi:MAG: family oxidoreductase [Panacagrimonas sp.]|jgi:NAD(P)-dependent dehydrogenase (short-subunit alcohol dehydrogenase family)/pimeloyl-ACP methyl ester carboxylesterase|nr:SDR family oxidoreductase [Panacagrimonas sp.]MCC2656899.1 family oxidoreductase [Panacagrimonas sp.]
MNPDQTVQSGDLSLAVYTWGTPAPGKPNVVLVHGYPDAASVWEKTAQILSDRYHVIAYDVRGAGRSDVPDHTKAFELEHLVEDLAQVVDAMSPDQPVHLVCHDWGSIQSWEAVTTERMAGRIASYTSISGPSIDHAAYWIMNRLRSGSPQEMSTVARQLSHSWYIGAFQLPLFGPAIWKLGMDKLWPKLLSKVEGIEADANPTQTKDGSIGVNLYRANFVQRLLKPNERRTDLPVQVIVAKRDRFVLPEVLDDLPQWVPNLWQREIDAGHWVQISHPEQVAAMAGEFIDFVETGEETVALRRARRRGPRKPMTGKLVVVTGAGGGIGRETLLAFAEQGASVVAVDIDIEAAERSAELARLLDVEAWWRQVDVGAVEQMEALAAWVATELGAPDIVVNNAGIGLSGRVLDTSVADWDRLLKVNLWSVILGSKLFAQQMIDAGKQGHIVNVASAAAFSPSKALPAYATTKAAVHMLSDCLRAELADHRINVVSVCPGFINTGITTSSRFVGVSDEKQEQLRAKAKQLYSRRNLKPQAVAEAILDAVKKNKPEALVGAEAHAFRFLSRFVPSLSRRLARLDMI